MSWRGCSDDRSFPASLRETLNWDFPSSKWFASSPSSLSSSSSSSGTESHRGADDRCSYTKLVRSRCFLDHTTDGKPIKKCEKTEQVLRNCIGRPQELVESKSESTEEEVPDGWTMELSSFDQEKGMVPFPSFEKEPSSPWKPFSSFEKEPSSPWKPFQGMDPLTKGLQDGMDSFMQAAEEMMVDAFNQLGFYRQDGEVDADNNADSSRKRFLGGKHGKSMSEGGGASGSESNTPPYKVDFPDSRGFDEA